MEQVVSNLSSGHFEEVVPNLSPHQISQNNDSDYINFFLKLLVEQKEGLHVTHVKQNGIVHPTEITLSEDKLEMSEEGQIGDTVYFTHLSNTYFFFIEMEKESTLQVTTLFQIHRRAWRRYPVADLNIEAHFAEDARNVAIKGKIQDITLDGLKVKLDGQIDLYHPYKLTFDDITCVVQAVYIQEFNRDTFAGLHILEGKEQYLTKFYSNKIDSFGLGGDILDKETPAEAIQISFEKALNPQRFTQSYLDPDPNAQMYLLDTKEGRKSAISSYLVNKKQAHIHTLILSLEDYQNLPTNLYEYTANHVLAQTDVKYFSGFWPSNYKILDRGYTTFVKNDYDGIHNFYKKITIYQCATGIKEETLSNIEITQYSKSDYKEVIDIIRENTNEVFIDAQEIDNILSANTSSSIYVARLEGVVSAISLNVESKSNIQVFGLIDQSWFFFKDANFHLNVFNQLKMCCAKHYERNDKTFFSIHLLTFEDEILKQEGIRFHIKDINYWITKKQRVKFFLNHLERLSFEISILSNLKRITKKHVKFLKPQKSSFVRRNSIRYSSETLSEDVKVSINDNVNIIINDIDTFGMNVKLPEKIQYKVGDEVEINIQIGDQLVNHKAIVVNSKSSLASGFSNLNNTVGLKFTTESKKYRYLLDYCFAKLNPEITSFQKNDYSSIVDLFKHTGYFSYYVGVSEKVYSEAAKQTYKKLEYTIPDLAKVTLLKTEDNKIIGTHSFYKRAKKTWQLHQLVVDEDRVLYKKHIPTKLVLQASFRYLCLDPKVNYFVTYFSDKAAIAKSYFSFRTEHDNSYDYAYIEFKGFVFNEVDLNNFCEDDKYKVMEASEEELETLEESLQTMIPKIEYEAFDYGDLNQTKFSIEWKSNDYQRDRKVFILKDKRNTILSFAIVDLGPLGVNMLGIHDNFRIFNLPWCAVEIDNVAYDMLCKRVLEYYLQNNRKLVHLEVDPAIANKFTNAAAKSTGKNWRLVGSRNTFMTALSFYQRRFERLEKRLNK
jgi:hypothetical protein